MMTKPLENQNQKHVSNNKGPVTTNSLKVFRSNSVFKQLNSEGELSSAPQDEKLEPRGSEESKKSVAYRARECKQKCEKTGSQFVVKEMRSTYAQQCGRGRVGERGADFLVRLWVKIIGASWTDHFGAL